MKKLIIVSIITLFIGACSNTKQRYQFNNDHAPSDIPPLEHIENVNPRYEPHSRGGNKDYTLRGIDYKIWNDLTELSERGGASWYGNKFHGHLTSNGERYNMFAMSAAHKNLPLPSYVQVTNVANNKQVIVRVNDRGPFHEGRIIDLSYAAAKKLDMLNAGTAQVEIKLLHFSEEEALNLLLEQKNTSLHGNFVIQYLVSSSAKKAQQLSDELSQQYQVRSFFEEKEALYYLRLGPLNSESKIEALLKSLQQDYPGAYIIHQDE